MGASRRVTRWLRHGYPLRFDRRYVKSHGLPPLTLHAPPHKITSYQDQARCQALQTMIDDLLKKNCIRAMEPEEQGFFSRVFLVPKKSGGFRLVIDLSSLNEYVAKVTFEMDTLKKVKEFVTEAMWATSIDLSEAYHHVPMHQGSTQYLCFQVGNKRYLFLVLPFGLSSAPWVFTEIMKQLKVWTSRWHRMLFQYLDDWLNMFRSKSQARAGTEQLLVQCKKLGLLVNEAKSELVPTQQIVFLGERLDFVQMRAFPTTDRKESVTSLIDQALRMGQLPFAKAESLLGLLSATYPTVAMGRLWLRPLQAEVIRLIRLGRDTAKHETIAVRGKLDNALRWWNSQERWSPGMPFKQPAPETTVYTDASLSGWGVVHQDSSWSGTWTRSAHINWLELRTVLIALQLLGQRLQNKVVKVMIDNTTAVSYIRNQGGTRSPALLKLVTRVWILANKWGITLVPEHIRGSHNVLADLASRSEQVLPAEWTLTTQAWQWLQHQSPWGPPTLELFANRWNHLLPRFISPHEDDQAVATDALTCQWPSEVLYAFPPAFLLIRFFQRLANEESFRTLLVVNWAPQAKWMPLLATVPHLVELPFPLTHTLLKQPHWEFYQDPPSLSNLRLLLLSKTPT